MDKKEILKEKFKLAISSTLKVISENSKIEAIITACFNVNTFAPTDVAKELAQSFVPIPHAL